MEKKHHLCTIVYEISTKTMIRRSICITLGTLTMTSVAWAQVEVSDTIGTGLSQQDIEELRQPISGSGTVGNESLLLDSGLKPMLKEDLPLESTLKVAPEAFSFPRVNVTPQGLPSWETGYIYGSSAQSASLLFGYMAEANMGIRQHFSDQWTFDGQVGVKKFGMMANTSSVSGSLNWHPSPYFEATVFGAYSPGSFMSPIDIGQSFEWGGYLTFQTDTNVKFGVDVGARQTYDYMYGHELVPIVQPFVKVGGAKIGIDLGPMIKESQRKKIGVGGPSMIPQPMKALPPVAPRR